MYSFLYRYKVTKINSLFLHHALCTHLYVGKKRQNLNHTATTQSHCTSSSVEHSALCAWTQPPLQPSSVDHDRLVALRAELTTLRAQLSQKKTVSFLKFKIDRAFLKDLRVLLKTVDVCSTHCYSLNRSSFR